jgi:tripartite ATP-independent transporter DctM subunit
MAELLAIGMLAALLAVLLSGYPVAFGLAGVSLVFALIGAWLDVYNLDYMAALPGRIYGIMNNDLLVAVPLFVFMGVTLERSRIAEELLETMGALCGTMKAGLAFSVLLVGTLLAASTGIVGATVVTMGLISLPTMLKAGYCHRLSTGIICAAGTLGQIIPPSVVLILLGDQITNAWQATQLEQGVVTPVPVTIADLFVAAIIPGLLLVLAYGVWLFIYGLLYPEKVAALPESQRSVILGEHPFRQVMKVLFPPLLLIVLVLGSILLGIATATESAAMGGVGAMLLSLYRRSMTLEILKEIMRSTARISAMVFTILIGATFFTMVFRGLGGEVLVEDLLGDLPGGLFLSMLLVMVVVFLLGFFLDFIEIIFIVVPIVAPILLNLGADPVWLAIMFAINLQTSFLTPPFGFSLFYLRGVAPNNVSTGSIYKGIIPFVLIQGIILAAVAFIPSLSTWLPEQLYGKQFMIEGTASNIPVNQGIDGSSAGSWVIDF